jgi:hypothetical protein
MRNVLRGLLTFVLLIVGLSLLLELAERDRWVSAVVTALAIAFLLVGSLVKSWRAMRYGDFSVTSQVFWLPRRWQAWLLQEPPQRTR